jgi:hypothetical protein
MRDRLRQVWKVGFSPPFAVSQHRNGQVAAARNENVLIAVRQTLFDWNPLGEGGSLRHSLVSYLN